MAKKATKPRSSRPAKPTTMFRPRASSTYSSAMSAMRTQALPKDCRRSGSTSSAMPPRIQLTLVFFMVWCSSGAIRHTLTQQARGAQRQDDDEHDEREDVGVVAAQQAAREGADVARADGFDQAQKDATDHGTGEVADTPEHGCREGLQAWQEAHGVLRRTVVARIHDAGDRCQNVTNDEGGRDHHVGLDAHERRHTGVFCRGAHGAA